jgi:SHS2 domain-containing protein
MRRPRWLEYLEHTADACIRVRARSLPELFGRAAWGMFSLIVDPDRVEPRDIQPVCVSGSDRKALMVRWLSELNYIHQTQHRVFGRFEVRQVSDTEIAAKVGGESIDSERHRIRREIKAVTFHGLEIEESGGRWTATVLFDV